jgi:3-deoxy-7-phosphoheptulonate synthase/chorismate mutase
MHNFALLKAVGAVAKPVLLKRGFMATIEEFLYAAEYILAGGNGDVILCERGIRTFERWTRNTLDISAVALLKQETPFPVIVDISHSAGRKDICFPLAKAALAAGADGLMVEVHNNPAVALSDAYQQLDFQEFEELLAAVL